MNVGPRFHVERLGEAGWEVIRSGYSSGGLAFTELVQVMAREYGRFRLVREYRGCRSCKEYVSRPAAGANGSEAAHALGEV